MNHTIKSAAAVVTMAATTINPSNLEMTAEFSHVIRLTKTDSTDDVPSIHTSRRDGELVRVAKEAINSLLDDRDALGYMIENARGNITDEDLTELLAPIEVITPIEDGALRPKVLALAALVGERIDAELVSVAFRCDFAQADRVLATWRPSDRG